MFDRCFEYVIANEGTNYVNDPSDPGHATRYGITLQTLGEWRGTEVWPSDIQNLSIQEAKIIYRRYYWAPIRGDEIKSFPVAACVFDTGVLYGLYSAGLFAQTTLNLYGYKLLQDGHVGPKTVEALNDVLAKDFVTLYVSEIVDHIFRVVSKNSVLTKYQLGWTKRAKRLLDLV